jgi:peptide-methionine (S)-S-oxide reductase
MLPYRQLILRISIKIKIMMNKAKSAPGFGARNLTPAFYRNHVISCSAQLPVLLCLLLGGILASQAQTKPMENSTNHIETATLGGGCFWCTEAIFQMLPGVKSVTSGYAGGAKVNPTYQDVCSGDTGHAEVIQIEFDPTVVSYDKILSTFWEAHDPTTLNRQGADHGTQYRSIILYNSEAQKLAAEKSKAEAQKQLSKPIVTEIVPLKAFYKAEGYHQDYFRSNSDQPYCRFVIQPKVDKFEKKLKAEH